MQKQIYRPLAIKNYLNGGKTDYINNTIHVFRGMSYLWILLLICFIAFSFVLIQPIPIQLNGVITEPIADKRANSIDKALKIAIPTHTAEFLNVGQTLQIEDQWGQIASGILLDLELGKGNDSVTFKPQIILTISPDGKIDFYKGKFVTIKAKDIRIVDEIFTYLQFKTKKFSTFSLTGNH